MTLFSSSRMSRQANAVRKTSGRRPRSLALTWEGLERRELLAFAAGTGTSDTSYLTINGTLYEHVGANVNTGWTTLAVNVPVAQLSAGLDSTGNPTVFVLSSNGNLQEYGSAGWSNVATNVASISASQHNPDTVYVLFRGGALWEHAGTNSQAGWTFIANNVAQASAGENYGLGGRVRTNDSVYVLFSNGGLWELTHGTWVSVASNVAAIDASQCQTNTVFVLFRGGYLWEQTVPTLGTGSWSNVANNVAQFSAGQGPNATADVYVLFNNGAVWQDTTTGWFLTTNAGPSSLDASQSEANTVFVGFSSGPVWEHTGTSSVGDWFPLNGGTAGAGGGPNPTTFSGSFGGVMSDNGQDSDDPDPNNQPFTDFFGGNAQMTVATNSDGTYTLQFSGTLTTTDSHPEDFTTSLNDTFVVNNLSDFSLLFYVNSGDGQIKVTGSITNGSFIGNWTFVQTNPDDHSDSGSGHFALYQT